MTEVVPPQSTSEEPEYPLPRTGGCPFAPHDRLREMVETPGRVKIWDDSTPWLVAGHTAQRELLQDARMRNDEKAEGYPHMTQGRAEIAPELPELITNTDGEKHTALRRQVNGPFMVKRVERLRPRIQEIVDELLDEMLAGPNQADLVQAYGLAVPTRVICEMLGVPYAHHDDFHRLSKVGVSHESTPEEVNASRQELGGILAQVLMEKTETPTDDIMSELAAAVKAGEMDFVEAITMASAILIAGHETSASMLSLGTLALLREPEQLALFRENADDPRFVANAVEELLRYLTIVHSGIRRIATEDVEVGGITIKAGEGVIADLATANYDPEVFADPDKLDLTRPARQHHAFGYGPHQCLGQTLARVELQVAYRSLYTRIPTLALAEADAEKHLSFAGVAYGMTALPVTW